MIDYNSKQEVLAAVNQNGWALSHASEELRNDKEVVLTAVKQDGWALEYVSTELKNDKELVLVAVKKDGRVLRFVSEELQNDKEVVMTAVKQNGDALRYANEEVIESLIESLIDVEIEGEMIAKPPVFIKDFDHSGWVVLITDSYMRIGCKRFTHEEWASFDYDTIDKMHCDAHVFWAKNRQTLLKMCEEHSKS